MLLLISYNSIDKVDIFIKRNSKEDKIMKKKIGLLLATVMVLNTVSSMAFGFTNPLKNYNLYEDTHSSVPVDGDGERERVMDEYYSNSLRPGRAGTSAPSSNLNYEERSLNVEVPKRRNEVLRESSREVYGNPDIAPGWLTAQSFYRNPSLDSIKAKYKASNFAGCLQECISYVRKYPNDTLGYYYMAMSYSKVSDPENAIKAYEKVIELNANPMIVKYATNGRNCVMKTQAATANSDNNKQSSDSDDIKCYPNVNEPDLIYPYANMVNTMNLTPVDPQTLVNRNLKKLQDKLTPKETEENNEPGGNSKDKKEIKINLPFGAQDSELDKFINAPYGNGLSPELNKEYKQIQLNKLQQNINNGDDNPEKDYHNMQNIKNFDKVKSEANDTIKLAYTLPSETEQLNNDPQYAQARKEMEELRMLLGNDNSGSRNDDLMDLIPYMTDKNQKISPEVLEAMMVRSMMTDFTFNSKNLL